MISQVSFDRATNASTKLTDHSHIASSSDLLKRNEVRSTCDQRMNVREQETNEHNGSYLLSAQEGERERD